MEPKDKISLEPNVEKELCEKLFVIPRRRVDNHNIGIKYDVTEKLEAKGIKVKHIIVERMGKITRRTTEAKGFYFLTTKYNTCYS